MLPKHSRKGKWKATARAQMPTLVLNPHLLLDREHQKGYISQHIRGFIWINNVCGVKDERAWDLFYDIIFLHPVMTRHVSQFYLMWPHCRSRSSPILEWLAAFHSYIGQMFDKTCDQINNWRWDNPRAFGDQVNRSNPQTTSSGNVRDSSERFSSYSSDDLRAKIEPPSCRQYKPGNFLAIWQLNSDEIIGQEEDDEN